MYTSSSTLYRDKTKISDPLVVVQEGAHYAIAEFLAYSFAEFEFYNQYLGLESILVQVLGIDENIGVFRLNDQMDYSPELLFKNHPSLMQGYQFSDFDRKEKICVFYSDGINDDGIYEKKIDCGLTYPNVFYSADEFKSWVCIFLLARLNFCPQSEATIIEIVKRYFDAEECLLLMNEKLMGNINWKFGLEGKYGHLQNTWQLEASDPLKNIPYLKWLAMAEASWMRAIAIPNDKK
jgi:hypothetical protein